jgi:hypothetical protein
LCRLGVSRSAWLVRATSRDPRLVPSRSRTGDPPVKLPPEKTPGRAAGIAPTGFDEPNRSLGVAVREDPPLIPPLRVPTSPGALPLEASKRDAAPTPIQPEDPPVPCRIFGS